MFEPNNANTRIRVKSISKDYLPQKWREGALHGARPEHALYAKIAPGVTMVAQDTHEGRMIVEIGMAVLRPAKFIILKFSHKHLEAYSGRRVFPLTAIRKRGGVLWLIPCLQLTFASTGAV